MDIWVKSSGFAWSQSQFDHRGVLIQSCSAGAEHFTNYVFCHPKFSGVIQNIENRCVILTPVCQCRLIIINFIVKNRIFKILLLWHNDSQYFG